MELRRGDVSGLLNLKLLNLKPSAAFATSRIRGLKPSYGCRKQRCFPLLVGTPGFMTQAPGLESWSSGPQALNPHPSTL